MIGQHLNRFGGVAFASAMLLVGACSNESASTAPLLPQSPSLVVVGDAVDNVPRNEVLTVCKVWVNATVADIDVTLSGGGSGTYTVPAATGTPPNTCRVVAIHGPTDPATITVTEANPGAGFTTTWTRNSTIDANDGSGSGGSATATVGGTGPQGAVITFTNTFTPPPTGNKGCTPGYWKQDQHFDSWPSAYAPGDGFNATFGIGTNWFSNSFTLLDGLQANGGGTNALARHAVAALLSAASGFYPLTTAQVIADVQAAYNGSAGIETTKNLFAGYNELGCPLN